LAEVELLAFEDAAFDFLGFGDCFPDKCFFWVVRFVDRDFDHGDPAGGLMFDAGEPRKHFIGMLRAFSLYVPGSAREMALATSSFCSLRRSKAIRERQWANSIHVYPSNPLPLDRTF
jgi:hypothetical protein